MDLTRPKQSVSDVSKIELLKDLEENHPEFRQAVRRVARVAAEYMCECFNNHQKIQ